MWIGNGAGQLEDFRRNGGAVDIARKAKARDLASMNRTRQATERQRAPRCISMRQQWHRGAKSNIIRKN